MNATAVAASGAAGAGVTSGVASSQGISLGGAGFLILYYVGIVEVLTKLGVLRPGTTIAGASSGALISTAACSGLSPSDMLAAGLDLSSACRQQRCAGSLDRNLRGMLATRLPADAWEKCRGSGWIALSAALPMLTSPDHSPQPLLVSDFTSNADLVDAAAASAFIPGWSQLSKFTLFRGVPVVDGSVASQQPCPPGVQCIRIRSTPPVWPAQSAMASFMAQVVNGLTVEQVRPGELPAITSTGPDGLPDPALLKLAADKGVDIAPGIFNKLPFSQREWSGWIMSPPDDKVQMYLYKLGKADAELWAKSKGINILTTSKAAGTALAAVVSESG